MFCSDIPESTSPRTPFQPLETLCLKFVGTPSQFIHQEVNESLVGFHDRAWALAHGSLATAPSSSALSHVHPKPKTLITKALNP